MASQQEVDLGIKRGIFSSTVFTIQAFLFSWLYQKPSELERNVSCMGVARGVGGMGWAFTPTLKLSITQQYLRIKTCITPLKSDMCILAVKTFSVKCSSLDQSVLISCYWDVKGCFWAWKLWLLGWLCEQSGHPGHDCADVEGWRWGGNLWGCSHATEGSCLKKKILCGAQVEWWIYSQRDDCWTPQDHSAKLHLCLCVGVLAHIQVNVHTHTVYVT